MRKDPRSSDVAVDGGARLDVLGVVELRSAGATVATGGQVQTTILAHLAMQAPHRVAVDEMVDAIWGDRPPATVRHSLSTQLSRLRRILTAVGWSISWGAQGYTLEAPSNPTDAAAFDVLLRDAENLADTGRLASAIDTYRVALALWRGEPLGGLADAPFVFTTRAALTERRRRAEDALAATLLRADRPTQAVALLDDLARTTPLDERRWSLLVEALDRAGRPADALAAAQNARRRLRDDLGLSPGAALLDIERRVVDRIVHRGDVPRHPFVGRTRTMATIASEVLTAQDDGPRLVVIRGEAGTGRSRLLEELDRRVDTMARHWTFRLATDAGASLGTIRAAVADHMAGQRTETVAAGRFAQEQARRVHHLAEDLRRFADEAGALILIDDLDRADSGILALVRDLGLGRASPALIVATVRGEPRAQVSRLLHDLEAVGRTARIDLGPLQPADAAELARHLGVPDAELPAVVHRSGGRPAEIVAAAASLRRGSAGIDSPSHPDRDPILAAIAIAAPDASISLIAEVTGRYPSAVLDVIGAEVALGVLETGTGTDDADTVRFAGADDREAVVAALPVERGRALHLLTARALRARDGDRIRLAHHLLAADDLAEPDQRVTAALDGARIAATAGAFDEALRLLHAAVDVATGPRRTETMTRLAELEFAAGHSASGSRLAIEAYDAAVRAGRWDLAADALLAETNLGFPPTITTGASSINRVDEVLAGLGPADQVRRMRMLVWKAHIAANLDNALADRALDEAAALTPRNGPHRTDLDAARVRLLASRRIDPEAEISAATALGERCDADDDPLGVAMAAIMTATAQVRAGRPFTPSDLARLIDRSQASAFPAAEYYALSARAAVLTATSTMDEAARAIDEAESFGLSRRMPGAALTGAMQRWPVRREQARLGEYADLVAELVRTSDRVGSPVFLAATQYELGDPEPAPAILERFVNTDLPDLAVDWVYDGHALIAADLVADLGLIDLAEPLSRALERVSGTVVVYGSTSMALGPADRALARLAHLGGDTELAAARIDAALELARRAGSALWEGWCSLEATRVRPMRPAARRSLLDRAADLADAAGSIRLATAVTGARR